MTTTFVAFDVGEEAFLFFSSDRVSLRPFLGAATIVFGSGYSSPERSRRRPTEDRS